jgi:hypothetical protein
MVRNIEKHEDLDEGVPYQFIECVPSIYPIDGVATPVSPGAIIDYQVPDMYGRPWATLWRQYHEQDMQPAEPAGDDIFSFD